ncbi:hypothetical protein NM688_g1178 [Phlebia brevispora]|uniref:Uncharacterized protein n=1 Tax=Phlebia brevispora TaxID=194682 RepID=A0ACC1TCD1_9APHY|nr:hypothetical protein NM688_g1178 [Phlebia brevispora]
MSVNKRDSLFPPSSIGRAQGGLLPRTSSRESLTAHPLLSPTIPGSSASSVSSASSSSLDSNATPMPATRYVPYTPRQRGGITTATTGTTMQSSIQASPQHHPFHGDATSKLQLMNLKAAAQKGGLDAASTGWAILEKLGTETDHGPEWNEIWNAISVGKATLLLPLEANTTNEPITTEFIKDHVAFWDGSTQRNAPMVTLSGLRGTMSDEILTIRSSLDTSSKPFKAILDPTTRSSAFLSLPPLPLLLSQPSPQSSGSGSPATPPPLLPPSPKYPTAPVYPAYSLTSHHPSLPLPPRPTGSSSKPPLPPRPRPSIPPTNSTAASRLSNPFASLFGRASTPTPPASPTTVPPPLHPAPSSSPTDSNVPHATAEGTEHPIGVPAFTISRRIVRRDVARSIVRALHAEIRLGLAPSGAPSWVAERTEEFAERIGLLPFVKIKGARNKAEEGGVGGYAIGTGVSKEESMQELGSRFQDFYDEIEEQLQKRKWKGRRSFGKGLVLHHLNGSISSSVDSITEDEKADKDSIREDGDDTEKESEGDEKQDKVERPEDEQEKRIREVLEAVERAICCTFYDRLFLQPFADDATHDEALSSRIAAVNLLDLTLSHLGVDVGESSTEVEAVVKACGEALTQLDSLCRSPAEKAAILVSAHKILVDGLSRLPPINLKSDEQILDDKTPRAGTFSRRITQDDTEDEPLSPVQRVLQDSPAPATMVLSPESTEPPPNPLTESPVTQTKHLSADGSGTLNVPVRAPSPRLTISPPPPPTAPTPVSGDLILPLMIFAAVKANPPHLVSHLLYTQRFRNQTIGGEESYCLINLMAVAEFLENVDLAALGLTESEKTVISTAELTPITINRTGLGSEPTSPHGGHASLRGRVEQQVDAIAGSANKVISGVVDSSFGVLRALLPGQPSASAEGADADLQESAPWNAARPGFNLLRRDTGFSIASLAASLPGARSKTPVQKEEEAGQQLVEVPSRPGSIRSVHAPDESSSEADSGEEDEEDEEEEEHDTRSIRSFESMMSSRSHKRRKPPPGRKSITDRLASMSGLARLSHNASQDAAKASPPASRRSSLLLPQPQPRVESPGSSRAASPIAIRIPPPNPRFLECTEDDIKVSEVGELLREYKRLVEAVRAMGGFHEDS